MTLKRLDNGEIYFGEPTWTPTNTIMCLVQIEDTDEVVEFNATPYDPEDYGRELFEMLSTKYADQVAACTEEARYEWAEVDALMRREQELAGSDWIANGDVMLGNQVEWLQYRQDLRDITLQPNYPYDVEWPTRPEITHSTPIDERIRARSRD